jgi:nucleoside-diphosphate-sugar epimerase
MALPKLFYGIKIKGGFNPEAEDSRMKIFITGATGYVGTNLIPRLKQEKHEITCLIRKTENHINNELFDRCNLIKGDITDRETYRGACNGAEIVIHLAVATPITNISGNKCVYNETNVIGTQNLLEECKIAKPKRIICFSSTAAIGRPRVNLIDENTPLTPVNNYGKSKKDADELIPLYVKKDLLPIITICFPHIYGPGEVHDLLKIVKMIKKGILPQIGFGPNYLPMIYISDAIDAILLAMLNGVLGEKYIIADEDPHDIRMIRKYVLSAIGISRPFYPFIPKYAGILGAYVLEFLFRAIGSSPPIKAENIKSIVAARRLSIQKAKKDLGFIPKVNFKQGINHTIEWYKEKNLI